MEAELKILFTKAMHGDQESYEDFLNLCSVLVKRYLYYLGGKQSSFESLEDLHQEIMISIHQKKHTYKPDKPLLPWLNAITKYRYIDYFRKKKRSPLQLELMEHHGSALNHEESSSIDFAEIMSFLSPRQVEMINLIKVEGLSYKQAATQLNVSQTSLKVSVHRIIKNLSKRIK